MTDGVLALPAHDFPLTLVDVNPSVLFILEKFFPLFRDKAPGTHGVPNVGKTPLGRIVAMAMSRYWVRKLCEVGAGVDDFCHGKRRERHASTAYRDHYTFLVQSF